MLQTLPEVDLEATVLNRLAVLEVLCKSQEHTIDVLQTENARLRSSLTASTSHNEVRLGKFTGSEFSKYCQGLCSSFDTVDTWWYC